MASRPNPLEPVIVNVSTLGVNVPADYTRVFGIVSYGDTGLEANTLKKVQRSTISDLQLKEDSYTEAFLNSYFGNNARGELYILETKAQEQQTIKQYIVGDYFVKDATAYKCLQNDTATSLEDLTPTHLLEPSYWEETAENKDYAVDDLYTTNGKEVEGRTEILIDNTLLVFFADHQAYYSSLDTLVKPEFYVQGGEFTNALISQFNQRISAVNYLYAPQRYNVPAFIYSTRINEETIDGYRQTITKFTQAFDLTPTVLALLGVSYNPNYYLGYPVMCEVENTTTGEIKDLTAGVLISHTGGMFSQTLYADNGIDVLYHVNHISSEQVIVEFSIPINNYIRKWKCITALYEYNLFTT